MKRSTKVGLIASIVIGSYMAAIGVKASQLHNDRIESIEQYKIDSKQLECLALNIYFESRGESELAQRAVAWVTLNRVDHPDYPKTICEVVWDDSQFSWTHDGNSDVPKDYDAWQRSKYIAGKVIEEHKKNMYDPTEGSIMFHESTIKPYWRTSYDMTSRIDNHIFYKDSL